MTIDNDTRNVINRSLRNKDFMTRVALGKIEGWSTLNKFGAGTAGTTERIVRSGMSLGEVPIAIDENFGLTVVSNDAADTGQLIQISYTEYDELTGDWVNKEGIAITNGLTPVTVNELGDDGIVGPAKCMIPFTAINKGIGVSNQGKLIGEVSVIRSDGEAVINIIDGDNQSLTSLFVVPSGHILAIYGIGRSIVGVNKSGTFKYKATPYGQPSQVKLLLYLSNSAEYKTFEVPYVFPEKTILDITCKVELSTALVSAWYDGALIDTEVL